MHTVIENKLNRNGYSVESIRSFSSIWDLPFAPHIERRLVNQYEPIYLQVHWESSSQGIQLYRSFSP